MYRYNHANGHNGQRNGHAPHFLSDVYISEDAFWSLCLAAVETFRKECYGFLVGYQGKDKWILQRAIPHQTAQRSYSWVAPHAPARQRIEGAMKSLFLGEHTIGWFHSHPERGGEIAVPEVSEQDLDISKPGEVILIMGIHSRRKRVSWRQNADGTVSGTLGSYHLVVAAYMKTESGRPRRLRVNCAYATGFNPA